MMGVEVRPTYPLQAIQWTGENRQEIADWFTAHVFTPEGVEANDLAVDAGKWLTVPAHPHDLAKPGEWLVLSYGPTVETLSPELFAKEYTVEKAGQ